MLDPALLRHNPAELAERLLATRGYSLDVAAIERREGERKQLQMRTQELQNLRNTRSKAIGQAKAKGEDVSALLAEVAGFGDELKTSEGGACSPARDEIEAIALDLPHLPRRQRAGGSGRGQQRRTAALGHAARVRFRTQ